MFFICLLFSLVYNKHAARVVKLVDALDSKSSGSDTVSVRFRPWAPQSLKLLLKIGPFLVQYEGSIFI